MIELRGCFDEVDGKHTIFMFAVCYVHFNFSYAHATAATTAVTTAATF